MPPPSLASMFQIGVDVLRTVRSAVTRSIVAQTGSVVGETTDADQVEWWQHVGFHSRPAKADAGRKAAQAVVIRRGDHDVAIASKDERGQELAGNLQDGETCVYAPGEDGTGQARILLKANGSIAIFTAKDNAPGGAGVTISANADGSIYLASDLGGVAITADKLTVLSAAGSGVEFSASGATLIGNAININGGSVNLGAGLNLAGVMTSYTASQGPTPAFESFATLFGTFSSTMATIIAASTATGPQKTAATNALAALATGATTIFTAFDSDVSYSGSVLAGE